MNEQNLNIVLEKLKNNKQISKKDIFENEIPVYRHLEKLGVVKCQYYAGKSIFLVVRNDKRFFEYIKKRS